MHEIRDMEKMAQRSRKRPAAVETHRLDTETAVLFYENDFYPLSNFSAFRVVWGPYDFDTSEHLYHWRRFHLAGGGDADVVAHKIMYARSAHDAFKIAQENKALQYKHWNEVKVAEMGAILRAKAAQHEYVTRKLLATGDRELIEDSWRDDFWGWGPDRDGENMLGKLWMEIRAELRAALPAKGEA